MTSSSCYCIMLRKATRRVSSIYDEALEPVGINIGQFSLLRNVARRAPISLTELGAVMELDRSTIGRNTKILERMTLLETVAGKDSREALLVLTDTGKDTLDQAIPLWEGAQHAISTKLGSTAEQFHDLLNTL
ncbi:MarR family winged helix-turn-helix transcriptional regulator [Agrobacterium sp. rho-13.3]|uniref:MarR family winged helix-turn-helix transcriptional regulator n=1 Tax=Agrobacterium sp. rho-13.3 TaxID=3072980 RepID=UPI002A0C4B11|nr:MarR family winged helix-turn-helix transcriptional regulator [Agrobacterium sp. rho-13.3]MDX8307626.1 MarR family winged helix-turn-helix transcriptional regulator [Agrobacterium sp. rho-13.3]